MDIPPETIINATLKVGAVYYFPDARLNSPDSHFFIVLNNNPDKDELLLLVCSSSKVDKVKSRRLSRNISIKTLVEISTSEYTDFTIDSIVDCNVVFPFTKQNLIQLVIDSKLHIKLEMPLKIITKLREGVLASPVIEESLKKILKQ